jgi:hypothetical protein
LESKEGAYQSGAPKMCRLPALLPKIIRVEMIARVKHFSLVCEV